jgi:hypothetical protein
VAEYGEGMKERIRVFLDEKDPPIVKEMDRLKQIVKPYWDVADKMRDSILRLPAPEKDKEAFRVWLHFRKSNPQKAKLFANSPLVATYNKAVEGMRVAMTTEGYPGAGALDAAGIKLGHWGSIKNISTREGVEELIGTIRE